VIPTFCCIYMYIGGEVCAVSRGRCSLIMDLVMFVVVFSSYCFSFSSRCSGGGMPVHLQFVSVFVLRLVLVL